MIIKILEKCGRKCCGSIHREHAKQLMSESKSIEEFLDKLLNEMLIAGGRLKLKDKNTMIREYDACYCGQVKHTKEHFPTTMYCHCFVGWYKQLFESALEKPVEVEIVQSIITGAESCKFIIHISYNYPFDSYSLLSNPSIFFLLNPPLCLLPRKTLLQYFNDFVYG